MTNKYLPVAEHCARKLDLGNADDRALFRQRVAHYFASNTIEHVREVAGVGRKVRRHAALRAIADSWIEALRPADHAASIAAGLEQLAAEQARQFRELDAAEAADLEAWRRQCREDREFEAVSAAERRVGA